MVLTRNERKDALKYVIKMVFEYEDDDPLWLDLKKHGIDDIAALICLTDDDINNLDFSEGTSINQLDKGRKGILRCFLAYYTHREATVYPIGDEFQKIAPAEFQKFRVGPEYVATIRVKPPATSLPMSSSTRDTNDKSSFNFNRTIKRDIYHFPTFKQQRFWDEYNRNLIATARAQDLSEVLDPTFIPRTSDDTELFDKKQSFMFAVFVKTLQTDNGKKFVREHEHDYDAQAVYIKLLNHAKSSTQAAIESSNILSYITSARIGDGKWRGTTESYILHWQEQVRLYESMADKSDHFSDGQKRTMLENVVHPLKPLRAVKNMADQFKVKTGTALSYKEYCDLLISVASNHDVTFAPKDQTTNKPTRAVYNHHFDDITSFYVENDNIYNENFTIDMPVSEIQAYYTQWQQSTRYRHPSGSRMPKTSWEQLSSDVKTTWDLLSDRDKKVILTSYNSKAKTNHQNSGR